MRRSAAARLLGSRWELRCSSLFRSFSQNGEKRQLASSRLSVYPPVRLTVCPSVCPSFCHPSVCPSVRPAVRTAQVSSYRTDFRETWYLRIFRKSLEKIQVSWKSDKNKWYFTWRPIYIFFIISRSFHLRTRIFLDKCCRENQNTFCV